MTYQRLSGAKIIGAIPREAGRITNLSLHDGTLYAETSHNQTFRLVMRLDGTEYFECLT